MRHPRRGRWQPRPGATLPELILVAWLFGLVLLAMARFARSQGALAAWTADRARAGEVVRVTRVVLGRELRAVAASDMGALAGDSVRVRAARGGGPICGGGGSELVLRYRGLRRPEPAKDSLLVIGSGSAAGRGFRILGVRTDPACEGALRLDLDRPVGAAAGLALVFENGSYSLADGALRYRRGAAGRQPLTEAVLAHGAFQSGSTGLAVWLRFHPDSLPRAQSPTDPLVLLLANRSPP